MEHTLKNEQAFPMDQYLTALVHFFDAIHYSDSKFNYRERVQDLRLTYALVKKHFAQAQEQELLSLLKIKPAKLEVILRTAVKVAVYCYPNVPLEPRAAIAIHYVYCVFLDDYSNDMESGSFLEDLLQGKQQSHPWWRLVMAHFPNFLKYYGSFCTLTIARGTVDFFQGCLIEESNFHGFPQSHDYPLFLRRMAGLGQSIGACLFPKSHFDEKALSREITSAIAQIDPLECFMNDLLSFYKEFDTPRDQIGLIANRMHVEGVTIDQALDRLTGDLVQSCDRIDAVFENKDPDVFASLQAFIHGYATWHLCDKQRYRLHEVYERCRGDSPTEVKFRQYCEQAWQAGDVAVEEWAVCPPAGIAAEQPTVSLPPDVLVA